MSSTNKSASRDYAFKFLYSLFLDKRDELKDDILNDGVLPHLADFDRSYYEPDQEHPSSYLEQKQKDFAIKLIEGTLKNEQGLRDVLEKHLLNWKIHQLDKVDLTVLLLGAFELGFVKETPPKVIINEAINLTKSYGSNQSANFINGILDKIAKSYGHQQLR